MSETIDRLDIEIQAQAASAIAEVDRLYDSLDRIANVLNMAAGSFVNAKTAIQGTSQAMRSLAKISLPNITTITQQLGELSQMDMSGSGLGATLANASNEFLVLEQTSSEAGQSLSLLDTVAGGVKTAFNGLLDVVKGVASGIGTTSTFIISNFTMIGRAATRLSTIKSLLSGILGPLIGFYGVRSLINLGKDAVELASDLTEVQNVVDHAFGAEGAKAVEEFVSTSKEEFGLAELAAKQYSSRFQAMGRSMGITADMVGKAHQTLGNRMVESYQDTGDAMGAMAINLTKLTADMASFYNVEQDTIAQAMNAVYTGQTRPLRQYGIDLTQATLAEWAMKNGLDADFQSMTQAQKAMLRYQYIMAQTTMVQNDFARTADTWANQIRLLKQNFQALGGTIGSVVVNVFKPLITWLNNAMSSVIAFAETIANALGKIFGWTIRREIGGGGGGGTGDLTDGLDAVGDAADGAGGSLGKANEEAEKLKRTLLGFDEINKLNAPNDTSSSGSGGSGGGSGGSGGGGGGASAGDFELVKTKTIFDEFQSDIQTLFGLGKKISDALSSAMESIDWQEVYEKARDFGTGLAHFLNGLISPRLFRNLGTTIAGAINAVLNAKDAFLNQFNFKNLGYSLAAGLKGFFETWDAGLSAKVFYKTINGIVDTIWAAADKTEWGFIGTKISTCVREALEGIEWKTKVYRAAEKFGSGLADFLNGLIDKDTFSEVGDTVAEMLNTALHFLDDFGKTFDWHNFGVSLGASVKSFFGTFDWMLTAHNFTTFAKGILDAASAAISTIDWKDVGYKIRNAFLSIEWKTVFAGVGDFIVKALKAVIDLAGGLFDLSDFGDSVKELVDALLPSGEGFAKGFTDAFEKLGGLGSGFFTVLGGAFQAIADAINSLPEGAVESFGKGLGIVAVSLLLMKGATGVAGIITSVAGALGLAGLGGAAGAAGIGGAATAVSDASAIIGGAAGATLLTRLKLFAEGFFTNAGASVDFTQKVQHALDTDNRNAFVGLINGLMVLKDKQVITGDQFNTLYDYMNSNETKGKSLADVAYTLGMRLGTMGVNTEQVNKQQSEMSKVMDTIGVKGERQDTIFSKLTQGIQEMDKWGSTVNSTGFGGLGKSFDNVGEKAEGADKKSGEFKTSLVTFIGGILGQTVTMALLGTAYKGIGDKATDAQTPIDNLKTKIDGFVTECKNKTSSLEPIGEDIGSGLTNGVETGMAGLSAVILGASQDAQSTFKGDNGINSPSTVYKGFGENLMTGLANGITGQLGTVKTAIDGITKTLTASMQTFVSSANKYGSNAATEIKKGLESVTMPDLGNKIYTAMSGRSSTDSGSFYTAGQNMANAVKNGANSVSMPNLGSKIESALSSTYTQHSLRNPVYEYGHNVASALKAGLSSVTASLDYRVYGFKSIKVGDKNQRMDLYKAEWYASGGFPNYGEVFIANEAGPEMVGRMGNKNVVANNKQIAEGIEAAVVNGMMKAASAGLFGRGDGTPMVLNATIKTPDGDVLARVVEKAQARRNARYQLTTVY